MRTLVTGADGMLGSDLCAVLLEAGWQVFGTGRRALDVADLAAVRRVSCEHAPDLIVHAAAYTNTDQAERQPEEADRVNIVGTWNVALACAELGAQLLYVSSCGVFDGRKEAPYTELDEPNPLTSYHRGKREGEKIVASLVREHFILRPGWLFGGVAGHRKNFVAARYREARGSKELRSAADKFGSPTYTRDFAAAAMRIVAGQAFGLYHVANAGYCSRHEYVAACVKECGLPTKVVPVSSDEFPRSAPVPAWEALDSYYMCLRGLLPPRPWREALAEYVSTRLLRELAPAEARP